MRGQVLACVAAAVSVVLMSLQAQRNVAIFAVIAVPQLARYGALCWDRLSTSRRLTLRRRRPAPARSSGFGISSSAALTPSWPVKDLAGQMVEVSAIEHS